LVVKARISPARQVLWVREVPEALVGLEARSTRSQRRRQGRREPQAPPQQPERPQLPVPQGLP